MPEDESRAQRIARALVSAHGASAAKIAAETFKRFESNGDGRVAELWRRVTDHVRKILAGDDD